MLESNVFRMAMMICGTTVISLVLAVFFMMPMVELDESSKTTYENVMNTTLKDVDTITGYQAVMFTVKARPRASVRHY